MSYEGYIELICANGHYTTVDAHVFMHVGATPCFCGSPFEWQHMVDETNGYEETNPDTYNARRSEIGYDDVPQVDHYGNKYFTKRIKWKPNDSHWRKIE